MSWQFPAALSAELKLSFGPLYIYYILIVCDKVRESGGEGQICVTRYMNDSLIRETCTLDAQEQLQSIYLGICKKYL